MKEKARIHAGLPEGFDEELETRYAPLNKEVTLRERLYQQHSFIAGYKEREKEEWISVEDKKTPDYDGDYLCMIKELQECGNVWEYQQVIHCLWNKWNIKNNQSVTHWKPLTPPKQ